MRIRDGFFDDALSRATALPLTWDIVRFRCKHRGDEGVHPAMKLDLEGGFTQRFPKPAGCINTTIAKESKDPRSRCYFCGGTHAILLRQESAAAVLAEIDGHKQADIDCVYGMPRSITSLCAGTQLLRDAATASQSTRGVIKNQLMHSLFGTNSVQA